MENVWKRWRGKSKNVREDIDDTNSILLEKIELAIERDREEKEEKRKKREKEKEVAKEKEKPKVEIKDKQKKLEEKWEMPRWMITYIDENQVEWEDDSLV